MHTIQPLVTQAAAPQPPAIDPAVKAAGDDAASRGVEAYTEWKDSLAPDVKATIRPYHAEWTARAKQADADAEGAF
jgi:hypothetical protein